MKGRIETCTVLFKRIGEKEKTLPVVESALHPVRTTKFRGLQGIQLVITWACATEEITGKQSGVPSGSNYNFSTSYAVQIYPRSEEECLT